MCKVIMFTNMTKIKNNKKLVDTCQELLSSQRDGFGYAMQTIDGIAGQRTNDIESFQFNQSSNAKTMPWSVDRLDVCNSFGNVKSKLSGGAVFHGRISTNNKALINVHPLTYDNNSYLIHNGVVTNHGPKYDMTTSNDTEHLLHYMVRGNGIQDIAANITGYYAIGMLNKVEGTITIARDNIAPLFSAWLPKLETFMFSTTEELILDFCEAYKLSEPVIEAMQSNTYLKFKGNELLEMSTFKSRGYGYDESRWSSLSLGYDLQDDDSTSAEVTSETQDYLDFVHTNLTQYCYIELNKSQISFEDYHQLHAMDKEQCEIFNVHGENLLDLYVEKTRRENAA